jgi:hypothetical protein
VIKPLELLGAAHRRLALIAGARAASLWIIPALTALIVGVWFDSIAAATWGRLGYAMIGADVLPSALVIAGLAMLAGSGIHGWLAWRATGFIEAAAEVDDAVNGHQEVLSLAALSGQAEPGEPERGALFALLRRRVAAMLEAFDPARAFGFNLGEPLRRSSLIAAAALGVLALATLAMIRAVTPDQMAARKLIVLARELANTPAGNGPAQEVIAAAERVESSNLPPEQKLQQLADLANQLEQQQQPKPEPRAKQPPSGKRQESASSQSQAGQSASGTGNGKGQANSAGGNGSGGGGKGQGPGNGPGSGNQKGSGQDKNSQNQGDATANANRDRNAKTNQQLAELQDQIAKAQAQIQAEHAKNPGPKTQPGGKEKGGAVKPDKNGDQRLASADQNGKSGNQMNQTGAGPKQNPNGPKPGGQQGTTPGGTQGDTHLGEFPAPVAYQHFYQPGEHGPPLAIHDARYVLFRLPEAVAAAPNSGKLTLDASGPRATTPYVNVPLDQGRPLEVAPNEQQLVPPRYRDLIR